MIDKIIVTVEAGVEKGLDISLGAVAGVVGFIFASSQQTADEAHDTVHRTDSEKKDSAEPEPAAASGGQGVRGGKKDRSGQGNIDQLEGLEHAQQQTNKSSKGQYGLKTNKSQQNIDNANKRIKSLEDAVE